MIFFLSFFLETRFLSVALAVMELIPINQTELELIDSPASAIQVQELKVCTTTAQLDVLF